MTFIEFVGFLISLFALIFLFLKKTWEEEKRRRDPEEYRKEQLEKQKEMEGFLKELGIEPEPYLEEVPLEPEPQAVHLSKEALKPKQEKPSISQPKPFIRERQVTWDYDFDRDIDDHHLASAVEQAHLEPSITDESIEVDDRIVVSESLMPSELTKEIYQIKIGPKRSRAKSWLHRLEKKKDLLIAYEIFKKPPGLRENIEPYTK